MFTSNAVIDETVTFILYETGNHTFAEEILHFLTSSRFLQVLYIDESIHEDACNIFGRYKNQMFSMVDCTSFAVMKKYKIKTALTLDKHFTTAGFKIISGKT